MAHAYPSIHVDGLDLNHDAITAARQNAERAGVAERVTLSVADAANLGGPGGYDLVTIFEALHDMSRPVDALSAARQIRPGRGHARGRRIGERRVHRTRLAAERTEYGWSVVSRLPSAMADPQTAATGAVMRTSVLRQYALQAGFQDVQTLPIDTDYWRFYRLLP